MSVKRKCLNLEEKVKAIRLHEKGISCKKISVEMGVGKTQIKNANYLPLQKRIKTLLKLYQNLKH